VSRTGHATLIMLAAFVTALFLSRVITTANIVPDDAVLLWANALAAGDGELPIGRILAAYPTIPFLATSLVVAITPFGTPAPLILTASALALLAGAWFILFSRAGFRPLAAAVMAALLALHPALLRAAISGPSEIILAVFLFLLCGALYDLRARSAAPEVMAVALALLGLTFSHPMGAALACAAIPFLIFAVRPEMLTGSVFNLVLALVFPAAYCVGAFSYMSWIFPGSGWSFLVSPAEGLALWAVGFSQVFGRGMSGSLGIDAAIAVAIALVISAPIIPVAIAWVRKRRPLTVPALVVVGITLAAAWITVTFGLFGDPAALAIMPPILAATILIHVPLARERLAVVIPLLVVGWVGGVFGLVIADPRGAANVRMALEGRVVDQERLAAISLGAVTAERNGILVDTFNAPAIVLGRGRARGLISPSSETFALGILFSRIDTPFVAVPNPLIGVGAQDRLNKIFPHLYRQGAPGYSLVYENAYWKLFARN